MQERGKDREYDVTWAAHISTQWYALTERKRKGQRVRCDMGCTHRYPVVRTYHTPLLTRPDST